jgi:hypothetical protein
MEINATIVAQVIVFSAISIWLILPFLSAYLAKNRNQSRLLWFFLTFIFPISVIFIAMKDKKE